MLSAFLASLAIGAVIGVMAYLASHARDDVVDEDEGRVGVADQAGAPTGPSRKRVSGKAAHPSRKPKPTNERN